MSETSETPTYGSGSFWCPHCEAITGARWLNGYAAPGAPEGQGAVQLSQCMSVTCNGVLVWHGRSARRGSLSATPETLSHAELVWPAQPTVGPHPNEDLSAAVAGLITEARRTLPVSPRSGCALARVALETLCVEQGAEGDTLFEKVGWLIENGKLREMIRPALDVVRIRGNDGAHAGELDKEDTLETGVKLLELINLIGTELITTPREIQDLAASFTDGQRAAIERRDG